MSKIAAISLVVMAVVSLALFGTLYGTKPDGKFTAVLGVDRLPVQAEFLQGVRVISTVGNIVWIIVVLYALASIGLTSLDYLKFRRLKREEEVHES
ncbi:MAG: hypothetical protein QME59_02415 [Candidatus Hydrothermarchaeota archaeon]|nr:hypothetical protein [Candidatus Hydrothermarchaeota archaeon]